MLGLGQGVALWYSPSHLECYRVLPLTFWGYLLYLRVTIILEHRAVPVIAKGGVACAGLFGVDGPYTEPGSTDCSSSLLIATYGIWASRWGAWLVL